MKKQLSGRPVGQQFFPAIFAFFIHSRRTTPIFKSGYKAPLRINPGYTPGFSPGSRMGLILAMSLSSALFAAGFFFRERPGTGEFPSRLMITPSEDAEGLSLEKAIETALSRHPDILSAAQEVRAAAALRLQAEARPDPILSLGTAGIPFSFKSAPGRETELNFGLEQTFEFPGRRAVRGEIGKIGEDIASLELERVRLVTAARVKKAYFRAVLAERTAGALEPMAVLLDRLSESILIKYQAGQAAYGDVLRSRVEKARLQNRAIEARREKNAARAELFYLLGRPGHDSARLTSDLAFIPYEKTAAQTLETARATLPSLKIAALRREIASAEVKLASLNRRPDLSAGLFFPSKNFQAWGFALGLNLPLSRKRWEGERALAEAGRETSLIASESRFLRLAVTIGAAHAEVRAAGDQIKIFEEKLLGELEDEINSELEAYAYGKTEAYALIDLTRGLSEARIEHLRALYLYVIALADLEVAGEDGELNPVVSPG